MATVRAKAGGQNLMVKACASRSTSIRTVLIRRLIHQCFITFAIAIGIAIMILYMMLPYSGLMHALHSP